MFMIHETLPKKRKIEKIMQCPFIKSLPLWYGNGFFLKLKYYYAFITKQMQKKHIFWIKFHPKNLISKLS
jgi:hypothetical protein